MHSLKYGILDAVVIVGDVRVGKTTLLRQCIESEEKNKLNGQKIIPTIAVEFGVATIEGCRIKFWDVCKKLLTAAGQKKFRKLGDEYMRKASAAIVVFDLTKYNTFHSAK